MLVLGHQSEPFQITVEKHGLAVPGVHRDFRRDAGRVESTAPVHRQVRREDRLEH